jgi:hypothetical protein
LHFAYPSPLATKGVETLPLAKRIANPTAQNKLAYRLEIQTMKILTAIVAATFAVMPLEAAPRVTGGNFEHKPGFRPHSGGTHFVARAGNGSYRRFHYGNGGIVIFDPPVYGGYDAFSGDDTVYEGEVTPESGEDLPYATPTTDPNVVISPYDPHAAIIVEGIPHGAEVEDPVSNQVFLNP